jgi:3-deoxy-D-manno-octulosonate 8-phosphate phosphatase (KDO 8-P phosphatase)
LDSSASSISRTAPDLETVAARFGEIGGVFLTPPRLLAERLGAVRGIVFDWDGVFNPGIKGEGTNSTFSEADSMGLNLLRYAIWRRDRTLPATTIITGEHNLSARRFATRENFDLLYQGVKDKSGALNVFCRSKALERNQLLCAFDDVNDLAMAAGCGLRVLVRRASSPLFQRYVCKAGLADYVTGAEAGAYAIRELCEMLLGLMDVFEAVVDERVRLDPAYTEYWTARQAIATQLVRL